MWKVMLVLVLVCSFCWLSMPVVMAEDGNNIPDQLGDIFSGKGNTYGGVEIRNIPIPLIPIPMTMMAYADAMIGKVDDGVKRDIRGGVRVVIDLDNFFK